jgi:hypothetical protein
VAPVQETLKVKDEKINEKHLQQLVSLFEQNALEANKYYSF